MNTISILFIITSHSLIEGTGSPTGVWLEELTTPYYAFVDAGYRVDLASIKGNLPPIDPRSQKTIGDNPVSVDRFLQDQDAMVKLQTSYSIEGVDASQYSAIFLPGGHGTMYDLPQNKTLAEIVASTLENGRIVAAVCHGPAGLVSAKYTNGTPVVQGRKIAAFTNAEEEAAGLTKEMPFLLETRLRELGANVVTAPNFEAHAIIDGNLITGQNPASSQKTAELVIEKLKSEAENL